MIADTLREWSGKLSAVTPRERAGLAALCAIAALTALVYAMDWAATSDRTASSATQAAAEGEALQSTFQSEVYRRRISVAAGDVWRWSRSDDAFAAEEVRAELEALCFQAGLNEPGITLIEQEQPDGRVGSLQASVSAGFDWNSFLALLEAFEASDLSFAVRSIDVSEEEGAQRLTMVIAAPLIRVEETP